MSILKSKKTIRRNLEELLLFFYCENISDEQIKYLNSLFTSSERLNLQNRENINFYQQNLKPTIQQHLPNLKAMNNNDLQLLNELEYNIIEMKDCFKVKTYSAYLISIQKCIKNKQLKTLETNIDIIIKILYNYLCNNKEEQFENVYWTKGKQYIFFENEYPELIINIIIKSFINGLQSKIKKNVFQWNEIEIQQMQLIIQLLKMKLNNNNRKGFHYNNINSNVKWVKGISEKFNLLIPDNICNEFQLIHSECYLTMLFILYLLSQQEYINNWNEIIYAFIHNTISNNKVIKCNDFSEMGCLIHLIYQTQCKDNNETIHYILENILTAIKYNLRRQNLFNDIYKRIENHIGTVNYLKHINNKSMLNTHNDLLHYIYKYYSDKKDIIINNEIQYVLKEIWNTINFSNKPMLYANHILFAFGKLNLLTDKQTLQEHCFYFILYNLHHKKHQQMSMSIDRYTFLTHIRNIYNKSDSLIQKWNKIINYFHFTFTDISVHQFNPVQSSLEQSKLFGLICQKGEDYSSLISRKDSWEEYSHDVHYYKNSFHLYDKITPYEQIICICFLNKTQ